MNTPDPYTQIEIVNALQALAGEGLSFWNGIDPDLFVARLGQAWSPAENVRHLIKATTPVTKALNLPGPTLITMFGSGGGKSESFDSLRDRYLSLLIGGVDAGKFAPDEHRPPADHAAWQSELIGECRDAVLALAEAAGRWAESDLDRYQIPHPLLGKLTVREMLFFTLYHHSHHKQNVARRLASPQQPSN
jgi:hypothetical protein